MMTIKNDYKALIFNIYGIGLKDLSNKFKLSDNICIFHSSLKEYKDVNLIKHNTSNLLIDHFYIEYKISKESDFFNKQELLLNILLYFIGPEVLRIDKISFNKVSNTTKIEALNKKAHVTNFTRHDLVNPILDISDEIFEIDGNKKELFEYIDSSNLDEMRKNIKLTVNWMGKSLRSIDVSESFLYLFLAIEALLTSNAKELNCKNI